MDKEKGMDKRCQRFPFKIHVRNLFLFLVNILEKEEETLIKLNKTLFHFFTELRLVCVFIRKHRT